MNKEDTTVTLKGGQVLRGDIVVVADGSNSVARTLSVGESECVVGGGKNLVFSFQVPTSLLRADDELRALAEPSSVSALFSV